jgi:hypothetical protein
VTSIDVLLSDSTIPDTSTIDLLSSGLCGRERRGGLNYGESGPPRGKSVAQVAERTLLLCPEVKHVKHVKAKRLYLTV